MSCEDWQMRIAADEANEPAVANHVTICSACRAFANELAENASALRSIEVDAAAYTALRARVMAAVQPKRRLVWLWPAAATGVATAVAVCIALLRLTAPFPPPEPPRPQAVVYGVSRMSALPIVPVKKRRQVRRPVPRQQLAAIKLLTDDPNVVIIWLVDSKKGDSL